MTNGIKRAKIQAKLFFEVLVKKMQKLMSRMRAAMEKYHMISEGDRIAVGVSGGKDSVVLLTALAELSRFYPQHYEVVAITLDMRFGNADGDFSSIQALCDRLGVAYHIKRTELASVIFDIRKESNPCSLCARMRRGILHDTAKELGCNKLALGHHMDDAAETFLMNLFAGGTAESFSPVTYMSRKDLHVIRPMILCRESQVQNVAKKEALPVLASKCPQDHTGNRIETKLLLQELNRRYPTLQEKIIGAMQKGNISGW